MEGDIPLIISAKMIAHNAVQDIEQKRVILIRTLRP